MSHDLYRSAKPLDVEQLEEAAAKAAQELPSFRGFEPGHRLRLAMLREQLPTTDDLKALGRARIGSVVIEGGLEANAEAFDELRRLFDGVSESLGEIGMVAAFAELFADPENLDPDELQVMVRQGEVLAGCFSAEAPSLRKRIFNRVIEDFGLPVEIIGGGSGFKLEHSASLTLSTDGGPGGSRSPESFRAQTVGTAAELVTKMEAMAGDAADEVTWRAQPVKDGRQPLEMEEGREILTRIVELQPAADAYRIEIQFALDRLRDLESLRQLCRGEDRLTAPFGGFSDSEGRPAGLEVWTSHSGHRLVLTTQDKKTAQHVSQTLGVRFQQLIQPDLPSV